jgi:membrane protein YdbS with pleckstrin-like domain
MYVRIYSTIGSRPAFSLCYYHRAQPESVLKTSILSESGRELQQEQVKRMNMILTILFPIIESFRASVQYDAGSPVAYLAIGLVFVIIVGAIIALLIVIAVKLLKHFRNKKSKDD